MKVNIDIEITRMELDGFEIPIPPGLSELMNRAGAWAYVTTEEEEKSQRQSEEILKDYDRKTVLEDGKLRTYLTLKT